MPDCDTANAHISQPCIQCPTWTLQQQAMYLCIQTHRAYKKCSKSHAVDHSAAQAVSQSRVRDHHHHWLIGCVSSLQPTSSSCNSQVYGAQSRIRKYTTLPRKAAVDSKFSQIIGRFDDLTKQVWALSNEGAPDPSTDNRQAMHPVVPLYLAVSCTTYPYMSALLDHAWET